MKFTEEERMLYDFPVEGTFDLANAALKLKGKKALDIGFGAGGASMLFALNGYDVTSIGLDIDSYPFSREKFQKLGIKFEQTLLEEFQPKEEYDLVWASHVLEHTMNVGLFLDKCASVLSKDGWLCIMVPPYKSSIVGGHVQTGWNLGQLMYVLLSSGYDIKNGHFIHHGYSICAFVQKSKESLPNLRMDIGDIKTTSHLWPMDVKQGFDGMLKQVNWFDNFKTYEISKVKLENSLQQNTDLKSQLENSLQQNAAVLESIKKEISQEREKNTDLKSQLENSLQQNTDLKSQLENSLQQNTDLKSQLENSLQKNAAVLESIKKEISQEREKNTDLKSQLESSLQQNADLKSQLENSLQKNTDLKSQLESSLQQNAAVLESIKKEISQEREKNTDLKSQLERSLQQNAAILESIKLESIKKEISQEREKIKELYWQRKNTDLKSQLESSLQQNTDLKSQLESSLQQNAAILEGIKLEGIKLESIKKEISQEREKIKELYEQRKPRKQKTSLYKKYKRSRLPHRLQIIKAIPIIGPVLIFAKRKILKWYD